MGGSPSSCGDSPVLKPTMQPVAQFTVTLIDVKAKSVPFTTVPSSPVRAAILIAHSTLTVFFVFFKATFVISTVQPLLNPLTMPHLMLPVASVSFVVRPSVRTGALGQVVLVSTFVDSFVWVNHPTVSLEHAPCIILQHSQQPHGIWYPQGR